MPVDPEGRVEEQLVSRFAYAPVELEVLVDHELLVPTAELPGQRRRVRPERDVFGRLRLGAVVVGGVAHPER